MTLKTFSTHVILFAIGYAFGSYVVIQYHELPNKLWYYVVPLVAIVLFSILYIGSTMISKKLKQPE